MVEIGRTTDGHHLQPSPGPRRVRSIGARIDLLDDGRVRIVGSSTRGFSAVAATPQQLARAIEAQFREAQIAAYARWRGAPYDLDTMTVPDASDREGLAPPRPPRPRGPRSPREHRSGDGWGQGQQRPDVHPIDRWERLDCGSWRSPGGRTYRPGTAQATRCEQRLAERPPTS